MKYTAAILVVSILALYACSGDDDSSTNASVGNDNTPQDSIDSGNPSDSVIATTLGKESEYIYRLNETRSTASAFDIGNNQTTRVNVEAPVPSMCYTKHEAKYNPCYVCHQDRVKGDGRANRMQDGFLQNEYGFSDYAFTNHWSNLFEDRSSEVDDISDEEILNWINSDNYSSLAGRLEAADFVGYIPDIDNLQLGNEAFDDDGFAKDGSGWVAFNYKPLPSTFWPSNGSTDDVMIRLHPDMRKTQDGQWSKTTYQFNLAIVEMALKKLSTISVDGLDENVVGVDLNNDGSLGIVDSINYPAFYVGAASSVPTETFLYPRYTEFLHSVRYVGVDDAGNIFNALHMKELRYMIKVKSYHDEQVPYTKPMLAKFYDDEFQEKVEGNNPPRFNGLGEKGLDNKMGWWLQAFIEDQEGELRPQTVEETYFCMGCHTNLGSTFDQTFSFARKVTGKDGWGYIDLKGMKDAPNVGETEGEILTYLRRVGGGSEFRAHNDVFKRYFNEAGELDEDAVRATADVYELITPSREAALRMSKSYKVIVERQSYIYGRDGNAEIPENVYENVDENTPTLPADKQFVWDMRLNWGE